MIRTIAICPDIPELKAIQQIRLEYDPLAGLIAPHITLVFPFEDSLTSDELATHIRDALEGMSPFDVRLQGITGHEAEYLFLNVKRGNDSLIEMHDRLYSGILSIHLNRQYTYLPHVTVGRLTNQIHWYRALEELETFRQDFDFTVDRVVVTNRGSDDIRVQDLEVKI